MYIDGNGLLYLCENRPPFTSVTDMTMKLVWPKVRLSKRRSPPSMFAGEADLEGLPGRTKLVAVAAYAMLSQAQPY